MVTILVTGSTGTIGSLVVEAVSQTPGVRVRAATREPQAFRPSRGNVVPVLFDWHAPPTMASALEGVDEVFFLTPVVEDQVEVAGCFLDEVRRSGAPHLVRLSTLGAELEPGFLFGRAHLAIEELVRSVGAPCTIVRPGAFMENFTTYFRPGEDGGLRLPLGDSASAFIDGRDIADVAAAALTGNAQSGTHVLTGPAALTASDVTEAITSVSPHPIHYYDTSADEVRDGLAASGLPKWFVQGVMELFDVMRAGLTATTTETVRQLTGHAPRAFTDFAADHARAWSRQAV